MPWPTSDCCAMKEHYFKKLQIGLAFAHIVYVYTCFSIYEYSVIQRDGLNFVRLYFLNYT